MIKIILTELRKHAPFTLFGALTGVLIIILFQKICTEAAHNIFYVLHPLHVVLSAITTASMYELHKCGRFNRKCSLWVLLVIGYIGAIGIATLSDSVIPYFAEWMLDMPNRGIHIGFIEKWWLVNPLAILGVVFAYFWPKTRYPHAGHVFLSTWASLFHILMATGPKLNWVLYMGIFIFLFFAVWLPCCLSDIVFPLLFIRKRKEKKGT